MRLVAQEKFTPPSATREVTFQIWENEAKEFVILELNEDPVSIERGRYPELRQAVSDLKGLKALIKGKEGGFSMGVAPYPKSRFDREFEV
jgi:hypothetical protein